MLNGIGSASNGVVCELIFHCKHNPTSVDAKAQFNLFLGLNVVMLPVLWTLYR
jgi:hypothetical protein